MAMLHEWFDVAELKEISKDSEAYAGFDASLVNDLRASFDAFLDEVVWSEASDFRQLLQADWMFTTERMREFYGAAWQAVDQAAPATLRRSVSDSSIHVGAITHPLLMSSLAHQRTTSPIHRGAFLTNQLLGRVIRPPNAAFTLLDPDLHPSLTTRQRIELQTGEVNCQVCHSKINSLGFALENFDAVGRFRSTENDQPINANGSYIELGGQQVSFDGARQLGDYLAGSPDCHRAFVEAAFEHFVKQPIAAYGPDTLEQLSGAFRDSGFNIRQLIVLIAVTAAEHEPHSPPNT
jgi:hypothetical protein